jgi:hypothetical protein
MKKRNLFIIIPLLAVCFFSCKKSASNKAAASTSDSYLPVTSGTTLTYNDVIGTATATIAVKMTGATSVINGKTYYTATGTSAAKGNSTAYYYAANHFYSLRALTSDGSTTVELQLGNDNEPVGYSWITRPTDNGTVMGLAAQTINTIEDVNITKVVNGKTYTNVIHNQVNLEYDYADGNGFQSIAVYDFYLAKGIGQIETDNSVMGNLYESQTLTSYTIK